MPKGQHLAKLNKERRKDLTNKKFGKLLVLYEDGKKGDKYTYKCLCDCGKERDNVFGEGLIRGKTKSCGCDYPISSRAIGLTKEEYYKHTENRLIEKRVIINECWEWKGNSQNKGYGFISWGQGKSKTKWLVHRISFTIWKGEIPKGKLILHSCDNPKCFNPDHLSIGTQKENLKQMSIRGRSQAPKGSKHFKSKLKEEDIINIRKLNEEGFSLEHISKIFKVTSENIWEICKKNTWKHV